MWPFLYPTIEAVTFHFHRWCPSRTWTSGSFVSVRWNASVHRLEVYALIQKCFWGMESEPMLTPREKSPLPKKFSSEEDRTHDAAPSRTAGPTNYQLSYSCNHNRHQRELQPISCGRLKYTTIYWITRYKTLYWKVKTTTVYQKQLLFTITVICLNS